MNKPINAEPRRLVIRERLRVRKSIVGRVPSPAIRERLRATLRSKGRTDTEIDEVFRVREEATFAVCEAMSYHRHIRIVDGRLEIHGSDAEIHQERINNFNEPLSSGQSLATIVWQQINGRMGKYKQ